MRIDLPKGPGLRFGVFGTPVRIGLTFPIAILAIPYLFGGDLGRRPDMLAAWLALVTVSVLVHEGGHVAALRYFGLRSQVSLNAFGGLTSTLTEARLSPWRSIVVSLAGPLTGMALAVTVEMALVPIGGRTALWLRSASWFVNMWWSLFNLMPIAPLDGGHVMRELVTIASRRRGGSIVALVAFVVAISVGAWWWLGDDAPWLVAIGIGLMVVTNVGFFAFTARQRTIQEIELAHERLIDGELHEPLATLLPIAWSEQSSLIGEGAYTTMAWALLHERRFDELAYLDATRFHPHHAPLLTAATAWFRGDLPTAMNLVSESLATGRVDPPDTYFNRVFGRLGELDRLGQRISSLPADAAVRAGERFHHGVLAASVAA